MANKKITELTALTDPDANDLLAIVDDPAGTPETKKITVGDLLWAPVHIPSIDKKENIAVSANFLEGSTTSGIQEAIDDISAGGVVLIPPLPYSSVWEIEETIMIDKAFWIEGLGRHPSELRLVDDADCDMFNLNISANICCGMRNIKLNGNRTHQNVDKNIITDVDCHKLRLLHVYIVNVRGWAVYADTQLVLMDDYCTIDHFTKGAVYAKSLYIGTVDVSDSVSTDKVFVVNEGSVFVKGRLSVGGAKPLFTLRGDVDGVISDSRIAMSGGSGIGIEFVDVGGNGATNVTIRNNDFMSTLGDTGIKLDSDSNHVQIFGNSFRNTTTPIVVPAGANFAGAIIDNTPYNPIGVVSTPFDNTNHLIGVNGSAAGPTVASQDYAIAYTPCRIISTGGADVAITIKDRGGNTISSPGATCDEWLEQRWQINWGAFSVAPTVMVAFK